MNGAQALVRAAADARVEVCFANPGTTELDLVTALDGEPRIRPVLSLFEGVATGAADGYTRMAGRPALALVHLGPGFANGAACLHNARRSASPVVTLVGDHATWHRPYDPPLASDIAGLAKPVSVWVRESRTAAALPGDLGDALVAATGTPGPVTLVVPADVQAEQVDAYGSPAAPQSARGTVSDGEIREAAKALEGAGRVTLLLGGDATTAEGLRAAALIAEATGCRLMLEKFPTRVERGGGLPAVDKLGYFPEVAAGSLPSDGAVVLVGAREPVAFFGYPGLPSSEIPQGCSVTTLARPDEAAADALRRLAERVAESGDATSGGALSNFPPPTGEAPRGPLTAQTFGPAVASVQPEGAIVVDEGITSTREYLTRSHGAPPHTYLANAGGAIGHGMPLATGAAVAAPDRPVLALQADGSGMYTLQALWTQAREGLDVTTVVCANRSYRILQAEMQRAGTAPGPAAGTLTDLGSPVLDWCSLAAGMGVPARQVTSGEQLASALREAVSEPGPHVVEALLEG
ncbi:MAG: acetolactate synthase large subunit [Actinomycetes bacterium]